jgi:putative hydrolase of the HAD superfamily
MEVVLFDLDDTLLDYSGAVADCWRAACAAVAGAAGVDVDGLVAAVEVSRRWFWADAGRHARERVHMVAAWGKIAAAALVAVGRPSAGLAADLAADFAARRAAAMALFPDALPCLTALRARGTRLGLVTNGDAGLQRDKLARFALAPCFDAVVIEGEFGTGKPDAAVYRHVLAALGAAPAAACMVGDNLDWDVTGAQRAGVGGVWIDRAGTGLPAGHAARPDRVIRSLAELWTVRPDAVPGRAYGRRAMDSTPATAVTRRCGREPRREGDDR